MKEISQEEFERLVQDLIDGKITKSELAKQLNTTVKTLNYKIDELAGTNPELYDLYLTRHKRRKKEEKIEYDLLVNSFDTGVRPKRSGLQEREEEVKETLKQLVE